MMNDLRHKLTFTTSRFGLALKPFLIICFPVLFFAYPAWTDPNPNADGFQAVDPPKRTPHRKKKKRRKHHKRATAPLPPPRPSDLNPPAEAPPVKTSAVDAPRKTAQNCLKGLDEKATAKWLADKSAGQTIQIKNFRMFEFRQKITDADGVHSLYSSNECTFQVDVLSENPGAKLESYPPDRIWINNYHEGAKNMPVSWQVSQFVPNGKIASANPQDCDSISAFLAPVCRKQVSKITGQGYFFVPASLSLTSKEKNLKLTVRAPFGSNIVDCLRNHSIQFDCDLVEEEPVSAPRGPFPRNDGTWPPAVQ